MDTFSSDQLVTKLFKCERAVLIKLVGDQFFDCLDNDDEEVGVIARVCCLCMMIISSSYLTWRSEISKDINS